MPGGIDSHVHLAQRGPMGPQHADDFESGSIAAACGGNTTIIPFANQFKGQSLRAVVDDYAKLAEGKAIIDYGIHMIVSDPTGTVLGQELPALIHRGFTSFKVFMTVDAFKLDDRQILDVLATARREGALVLVHAESHDVIGWLSDRLLQADQARAQVSRRGATALGRARGHAPGHHALRDRRNADPDRSRVGARGDRADRAGARARHQGLRRDLPALPAPERRRPRPAGARGRQVHVRAADTRQSRPATRVWRALERGTFDVFSSDHAPFCFDSAEGKKLHGSTLPSRRSPTACPVSRRASRCCSRKGCRRAASTLPRFVALSATNAAKIYGLYPRKGTLAIGADADIAIWDPGREVTITKSILHDRMDYTPYEGMRVTGWPVMTLSRGEVVWDDGRCSDGRAAVSSCRANALECLPLSRRNCQRNDF